MKKYLKQNFLYLITILLATLACTGAAVYRLYSLNKYGVSLSLILAAIIFFLLLYYSKSKSYPEKKYFLTSQTQAENQRSSFFYLSILIYAIAYLIAFSIVFTAKTDQAIISPWEAVPPYFFIFYGLATIVLIFAIASGRQTKLALGLISLHYFLSLAITIFVYKIGYGFDSFIHQTTAALINKAGVVYPKPFYYLGQYSLVVILHKITTLPIIWIDKLLVPILASVLLPAAIFRFSQKWFSDKKIGVLLLIAFLTLPFSFFIVTTPQNLAYLFLLLTLFYGLVCANTAELAIVYLLAAATLSIHPLAGIPAFLFALTLTIYHSDKKRIKKYLYLLVFIFSAISLPLSFYFINKGGQTAAISSDAPAKLEPWNKIIVPGQENFILNFIYLYAFNIKTIICFLITIGLIIVYRHRQTCRIFFLSLMISASLMIAYLLTSRLPFSFLIFYERNDYLERILVLAIFFLAPFIMTVFYGLIEKILEQKMVIKIAFLVFLALLITTSFYLSYPRFDRLYNSHGYSTGKNDIAAVHWIASDAGENDYIVLANQQVSVAALHEFGFDHYLTPPSNSLLRKEGGTDVLSPYEGKGQGGAPSPLEGEGWGEVYFYPIPTGGPLYQYYLDMVYKRPSRETMISAMDLAGVNQGYFVLNKYWWAFDKIRAEAELEADSWEKIASGEIYIFQYKK